MGEDVRVDDEETAADEQGPTWGSAENNTQRMDGVRNLYVLGDTQAHDRKDLTKMCDNLRDKNILGTDLQKNVYRKSSLVSSVSTQQCRTNSVLIETELHENFLVCRLGRNCTTICTDSEPDIGFRLPRIQICFDDHDEHMHRNFFYLRCPPETLLSTPLQQDSRSFTAKHKNNPDESYHTTLPS